jgi:hypothetical protein
MSLNRYTNPDTITADPPRLDPHHMQVQAMMTGFGSNLSGRIVNWDGDIEMLASTALLAHDEGDHDRVEDMVTLARTGALELIASGELDVRDASRLAKTVLGFEASLRAHGVNI